MIEYLLGTIIKKL